jgi:predicted alpha/beta-hydrolase family hydrolase
VGDARLLIDRAHANRGFSTDLNPRAGGITLVLGHGAGGGAHAPDLTALAGALPARGVTVVRLEQPWRVAGRRVAPAPATLDRAWLAAVPQIALDGPLVVGGRSAGARVACRTARTLGAVAVLALAFPLQPPGRPDNSRAHELLGAGVPTLVVQGDRDVFGAAAQFPPGARVVAVPEADHSFAVRRRHGTLTGEEALGRVIDAVDAWLGELGELGELTRQR